MVDGVVYAVFWNHPDRFLVQNLRDHITLNMQNCMSGAIIKEQLFLLGIFSSPIEALDFIKKVKNARKN